jgi:hypothetical protein
MTEQITIRQIFINKADKNGRPYRDGQVRVAIKDDAGRSMSQFFDQRHPITSKRPGDTLTVETEQAGQFLNFTLIEPYGAPQRQQEAPRTAPLNTIAPTTFRPDSGQAQLDRIEKIVTEILARQVGDVPASVPPADAGDFM